MSACKAQPKKAKKRKHDGETVEDEDEEECGDEEEIMDDKEGDGEEVREWKIMGDDGSDTIEMAQVHRPPE